VAPLELPWLDGGRLDQGESGARVDPDTLLAEPLRPRPGRAVVERAIARLKAAGAKRILELGCAEGRQTARLLREPFFEAVAGVDPSPRALAWAEARLARIFKGAPERCQLIQSAPGYADSRLAGFDAAVCQEFPSRLEPWRIPLAERALFEAAAPRLIIATRLSPQGDLRSPARLIRRPPQRSRWDRARFEEWARAAAARHVYRLSLEAIGDEAEEGELQTLMAVFEK
jgi:SAM-dependent methyltransferase